MQKPCSKLRWDAYSHRFACGHLPTRTRRVQDISSCHVSFDGYTVQNSASILALFSTQSLVVIWPFCFAGTKANTRIGMVSLASLSMILMSIGIRTPGIPPPGSAKQKSYFQTVASKMTQVPCLGAAMLLFNVLGIGCRMRSKYVEVVLSYPRGSTSSCEETALPTQLITCWT